MKAGLRRLSLTAMIMLYVAAGINHFWHPQFYIALIPRYLPNPGLLNIVSGICEIAFGFMLVFIATRRLACYCIIAMLIAFIPAHIYSIELKMSSLVGTTSLSIVWIRLFIIHPFLLAWPYSILKNSESLHIEKQ